MKINTLPPVTGMPGLYIHMPMCRRKCRYCDFYSVPYSPELAQRYLDSVITELDKYLDKQQLCFDTVYFGGGTPSVFPSAGIGNILDHLRSKGAVAAGAEITCEANPESAGGRFYEAVASYGVNRISLGFQSCQNDMLDYLGRLHTHEEAGASFLACRKYCTDNISLDLMYGLPGQDIDFWKRDVETAAELEPAHISCYALKLEEGTPMWKESPVLPEDDEQADMYLECAEILEKNGLMQYEISNFSRTGMESRHNLKYWRLEPYLGIGPAAHSFLKGKRFYYPRDIMAFTEGRLFTLQEPEDEFSEHGRLGEYIMLGLRIRSGISFCHLEKAFGINVSKIVPLAERLSAEGYGRISTEGFALLPKGYLISNSIIEAFLEILIPGEGI